MKWIFTEVIPDVMFTYQTNEPIPNIYERTKKLAEMYPDFDVETIIYQDTITVTYMKKGVDVELELETEVELDLGREFALDSLNFHDFTSFANDTSDF